MTAASLARARGIALLALGVLAGSVLQPTERLAELFASNGGPTGAPSAPRSPAAPDAASVAPDASVAPQASGANQCATFPDAPSTTDDQAAAIEAFLVARRGQTICFEAGATYRVDETITLRGWSGTILGRGATWRRSSAATDLGEQVRLVEGHGITIDGLAVVGNAGVDDIRAREFGGNDRQDSHAFALESVTDVTIRNGRATNTWGDGVYIRSWSDSPDNAPSAGVVLEDLVLDVNGRNAISVISVNGLVVTGVQASNSSLHGFDAEPNRASDVVTDVRIEGSVWRSFDAAASDQGPGYAIVLTPGYADVQVSDISIVGNVMDRARIRIEGFSAEAPASMITVVGNRSEAAGDAIFRYIHGLTFSDNGLIGAMRDLVD